MDFPENEAVNQKLFHAMNEEAGQNHWRQEDLAVGDRPARFWQRSIWESRPAIMIAHVNADTASRRKGTE